MYEEIYDKCAHIAEPWRPMCLCPCMHLHLHGTQRMTLNKEFCEMEQNEYGREKNGKEKCEHKHQTERNEIHIKIFAEHEFHFLFYFVAFYFSCFFV